MVKPLGVCIVGTGEMASKHAQGWRQVPRVKIVSVVGRATERAEAFIKRWNLSAWETDYRQAIARDEVDVVSICVPTYRHADVAVYAAEQGKHILCEIPMALTMAEAERMISAAEQHNVTLAVGFMRTYSPVQQELKRWFVEGRLGRPVLYHATDIREIRPKIARHDPAQNGSPVIDMAVHVFSSWLYLFNSEPVQVYAQGATFSTGRPIVAHLEKIAPDTAAITVTFASGDIGTLVICWGLPPGTEQLFIPDRIYAPQAYVEAEFDRLLTHQSLRVSLETTPDQPTSEWHEVAVSGEQMVVRQIVDFAKRLRSGQPALMTGQDGKAALQIALAAMESLETGQPVRIGRG